MKKNDLKKLQFWEYDEKGKVLILHAKLIAFLESKGFLSIKLSGTSYILVRKRDNRISTSSFEEAIQTVRNHINKDSLKDVYEAFAKGVGSYITNRKLSLLHSVELINDRDFIDGSRIFFKNQYVALDSNGIANYDYKLLRDVIWENRLLERNFEFPKDKSLGQFEKFCWNLSKKDKSRFEGLMSIIGYMLHRNKDLGEDKAVILYDENMGIGNKANGGTGKTLLCQAIGKVRELELFEGKDVKTGSWFKNQRINITTDIIAFDDLSKSTSLEEFFPMITSGIEVEKKRQQAFFLPRERTPKVIITSNYLVKGPGGSSDERRRHEFEIANHYNENFLPEHEFGIRFFDPHWSDEEWNKFYFFMMQCIQIYLAKGLIKVESINLDKLKLESISCKDFVEFANLMVEYNEWIDKRLLQEMFIKEYSQHKSLSAHKFKKWLEDYAVNIGGNLEIKSTGGNYLFRIIRKEETHV